MENLIIFFFSISFLYIENVNHIVRYYIQKKNHRIVYSIDSTRLIPHEGK